MASTFLNRAVFLTFFFLVPAVRSHGSCVTEMSSKLKHFHQTRRLFCGECVTPPTPLTHPPPPPHPPGPHDQEQNWILAFSRAQHNQTNNPLQAVYHDDWPATLTAYPYVAKYLNSSITSLLDNLNQVHKYVSGLNYSLPYTRLCVPSATGLHVGLKPTDFIVHFNPTGTATDSYATLFYKAFIRKGKVLLFGQSAH